ncbi:MAG: hypothetical protein DHS20C13_00220 [Thermodesulfobacteriota bacterium]|nr:MAG: hypothetical protein DHS20C13_00220 [Thermodesulfobacteriota bacterium]
MSKREIELEILQCDHEDENGERCTSEGDDQAIKVCSICNKDLCITHYDLTTVTIQSTRDHFTYYFCPHHNDEFLKTLVDKFGDTRPIPGSGYGLVLN